MKTITLTLLLFSTPLFAQSELDVAYKRLNESLSIASMEWRIEHDEQAINGIIQNLMPSDLAYSAEQANQCKEEVKDADPYKAIGAVITATKQVIDTMTRHFNAEIAKVNSNIQRVDSRIDKLPTRVETVVIQAPAPYVAPSCQTPYEDPYTKARREAQGAAGPGSNRF